MRPKYKKVKSLPRIKSPEKKRRERDPSWGSRPLKYDLNDI